MKGPSGPPAAMKSDSGKLELKNPDSGNGGGRKRESSRRRKKSPLSSFTCDCYGTDVHEKSSRWAAEGLEVPNTMSVGEATRLLFHRKATSQYKAAYTLFLWKL